MKYILAAILIVYSNSDAFCQDTIKTYPFGCTHLLNSDSIPPEQSKECLNYYWDLFDNPFLIMDGLDINEWGFYQRTKDFDSIIHFNKFIPKIDSISYNEISNFYLNNIDSGTVIKSELKSEYGVLFQDFVKSNAFNKTIEYKESLANAPVAFFTHYSPNIGNYSAYLISQVYSDNHLVDYAKGFNSMDNWDGDMYLILYDKTNKTAHAFKVFYHYVEPVNPPGKILCDIPVRMFSIHNDSISIYEGGKPLTYNQSKENMSAFTLKKIIVVDGKEITITNIE